ncbi:EF-P lysine aminoacylase GenX [Geobacter pelophilus]|uniref:EF-P lysine aminoacylase GenX n=1 Tax=Geoanaerobacter pelophilus TaxID=60036 RepID=A0AAW4LBD7_9BACT|nr:EF-P lysine aminoacylase EpmA [Geoanaerobacter pelophilus]MBT0666413.1 EF-P lysine aminoacylase GenX [Geoanaerobacter pelophilus]
MNTNWTIARRRPALEARARIIQSIRQYFIQEGFLETETPLRIPAPAPESHIDAIPSDGWFLQTSPELCMKRLLAAGYERIFQLCHCWRAEERGNRHLPEFTMLEWYRAHSDYNDLMVDCENMMRSVAATCGNGSTLMVQGKDVKLDRAWQRLTVREAFARFGGITMEDALAADRFDEVMVEAIEPQLGIGQPTFLCDYPAARGALARLKADDPSVAERFELYISGIELANGFSELTDASEQRFRFEQEEQYRRSSGRIPYPEPSKFLEELPAMPPAAGIALGVDRLVMVMLDATSIDQVVAFTPEEL